MINFKNYLIALSVLLALVMTACQDSQEPVDQEDLSQKGGPWLITSDVTVNAAHFQVTLMDGYPKAVSGGWEWRWKIVNPNPSSSHKDLSHWNIALGNCATIANVVSAAYSTNQTTWTPFTPEVKIDPSTPCCNEVGPTLKFPVGTSGSDPMYYRLILNANFQVDMQAVMIIKYGTQCSIHTFPGIGCENNVPFCFTEPTLVWGGNRTFRLSDYKYTRYVTNGTGLPKTYNLTDDGGNILGTISITDNTTTVTVTFTAAEGWLFSRTYLDVACSNSALHAYGGYPQLSLFDYKDLHDPPYVTEFSYTFDNPMCRCKALYLMTYALMVQQIPC